VTPHPQTPQTNLHSVNVTTQTTLNAGLVLCCKTEAIEKHWNSVCLFVE